MTGNQDKTNMAHVLYVSLVMCDSYLTYNDLDSGKGQDLSLFTIRKNVIIMIRMVDTLKPVPKAVIYTLNSMLELEKEEFKLNGSEAGHWESSVARVIAKEIETIMTAHQTAKSTFFTLCFWIRRRRGRKTQS